MSESEHDYIERFETNSGRVFSKREAKNGNIYYVEHGEGMVDQEYYRRVRGQVQRDESTRYDISQQSHGDIMEPREPQTFEQALEELSPWQLRRRGWME